MNYAILREKKTVALFYYVKYLVVDLLYEARVQV